MQMTGGGQGGEPPAAGRDWGCGFVAFLSPFVCDASSHLCKCLGGNRCRLPLLACRRCPALHSFCLLLLLLLGRWACLRVPWITDRP